MSAHAHAADHGHSSGNKSNALGDCLLGFTETASKGIRSLVTSVSAAFIKIFDFGGGGGGHDHAHAGGHH